MTYLFDRKGYCVRHPHVRLRKKKLLGDWKVLIKNCPDCCVEEMGRLKRAGKRKKDDTKKKNKKDAKASSGSKKKENNIPTMPDLRRSRSRSRSQARGRSQQDGGKSGRDRSKSVKSRQNGRSSSIRGRSKSIQSRQSACAGHRQQVPPQAEDDGPVFEFDISLDEQGDLTAGKPDARSVKSRKSHKSALSRKSGKSAKTNKSTRTSRTAKSSKSRSSRKGSGGRSSSRHRSKSRESRPRSRDAAGNETVVSRGSQRGSSQRFIRQGPNLKVAKMPFADKYKREGSYTGEINEYGQPHGHGTLRYKNGMVYEGLWEEGESRDMDENMDRAKGNGFAGNWKNNTKMARSEREKRRDQDMDDLRSFISQSVRSGSVGGGGGSQLGNSGKVRPPRGDNGIGGGSNGKVPSSKRRGRAPRSLNPGDVKDMRWSDVNGFSGLYTGEVNSQNVPDGHGSMRYSNGVLEEGTFCNGVYQPPADGPAPSSGYMDDVDFNENNEGGDRNERIGIPSSSMSVWSLKSSPTMAFTQGGHNVLTGNSQQGRRRGSGASSVAPTSVHLGGHGGGSLYGNAQHRY